MRRESTGTYESTATGGETVRAFVPRPLPPTPRIRSRESLGCLLEEAAAALGRLDAVTELLPDPTVLVYGFVRKEAVLSSRIEGLQSSLADLMLHEAGGTLGIHATDILETSNAVCSPESRGRALAGWLPDLEPPHAGDARQVVCERSWEGHDSR